MQSPQFPSETAILEKRLAAAIAEARRLSEEFNEVLRIIRGTWEGGG